MGSGRAGRAIGALVAVLVMSAVWAGGASALLVHTPAGQTLSIKPVGGVHRGGGFDAAFGNLDYNGGPVMAANTDYAFYWSPGGYSAYGSTEYATGIDRYFADVAHDSRLHTNTFSVDTQYNDLSGQTAAYAAHWGGALLDTDPYPASGCPTGSGITHCLTDAEIQHELNKYLAAHGLPRDLAHLYFLLTPPHIASCTDSIAANQYDGCSSNAPVNPNFCAYHAQSDSTPVFLYSVDMYAVGDTGCEAGQHPNGPSDGEIDAGISHEQNEAITDPMAGSGWIDYQQSGANGSGGEIGDQCDTSSAGDGSIYGPAIGTASNGALYNQVINGHDYYVQEEWSNAGHHCLQRLTPPAAPPASFSPVSDSGDQMTFTAVASSSIYRYDWQFNTAPGITTPLETTSRAVNRTFPSAKEYVVGLTTFESNGMSHAAGGTVTPGYDGFDIPITTSPAHPVHGSPVTLYPFTDLDGQTITYYSWNFGDGGTGTGSQPTHTFAAAGTYRVRLTMFVDNANYQYTGLAWVNVTVS